MALTPAQIDALADYTNAQMVKLLRWAMAELAGNPDQAMVTVAGRTFSQQNLSMLRETIAFFEQRAAADADAIDAASYGAPVVAYQGVNE